MSLRPEEVEEEARAKDCSNRNTHKDIIRGDADKIIVVYMSSGMSSLNAILLIHVIWVQMNRQSISLSNLLRGDVPDSAAVPTDSDTTHRVMAI
jgi:hypothetical protein